MCAGITEELRSNEKLFKQKVLVSLQGGIVHYPDDKTNGFVDVEFPKNRGLVGKPAVGAAAAAAVGKSGVVPAVVGAGPGPARNGAAAGAGAGAA